MTTQMNIFGNEGTWALPSLLVVLMTILAILGVVAGVAAA